MAKVKIQGNASGAGVITLVAPNTNTDRTVTLPDESITLGGGVDGIVSSADATAMTITSAERIGVGETTPDAKFEIYATSETALNVVSSVSGEYTAQFKSGSTNATPIIHCQDSAAATILQVLADGRGLSQFTAKAWCNYNGTGTPSFYDSHNFSSIVDNGTGDHTFNFTNNLANASYSMQDTSTGDTKVITIDGLNASWLRVVIRQTTNGTTADVGQACILCFGD